jgi:hypothetical protein
MWRPQVWTHRGAGVPGMIASNTRGAAAFAANAVNFDGTNDYLTKAAALTITDGKAGTISFWIKFNGGNATLQRIVGDANKPGVNRLSTDKFQIACRNAAAANILNVSSTTSYTDASGWVHVLCSWNLATPVVYLYVNDASDLTTTTLTDDTIDYDGSGAISIGASTAGADKLNADVADFWFSTSFFDLSVEANRRLFRSAGGKPVDLGATGTNPGVTPIVFLSGDTASWETNKGSGGGFTEKGALTTASSSPSD